MPGIVGIVSRKPPAECERLVAAMLESMRYESFYESGEVSDPDLGVYAGWTALPGSFSAAQSRSKQREGLAVIMSGECYSDGHRSCVAAQYLELGDDFVKGLNGLFSGLVVDSCRQRALLFNDRYGLERIYFHETAEAFYFASEAKALLRVLPETRAFDPAGVAQLLAVGCTMNRQTLFRGVELMPGGSTWSFGLPQSRRSRYFVPENWEAQPVISSQAFEEQFAATFRRVLPRYLGTGARLGVSLTGGLDTRMIMACLPSLTHAPATYTFAGQHGRTIDERLAARVAAACGLEHHVLRLEPDFLRDFPERADRTVYVTDGCFGATGAHEIYLNAKGAALAPVRVTGNFGSEVLRSMSTFKPHDLSPALITPDFQPHVAEAGANAQTTRTHPVTFSAFMEIPWNLFGSLAAGRSQVTFRTPYLDNEIVALAYQAPAESRRSTSAALRVVGESSAQLGQIPTDRGLKVGASRLGQAFSRITSAVAFKVDYLNSMGLPDSLSAAEPLLRRIAEAGLWSQHQYLSYRRWFQQDLSSYVMEVLGDSKTARLSFLNSEALPKMGRDHIEGRRNYVREIGAALTLEAADRLLIRGSVSNNTI